MKQQLITAWSIHNEKNILLIKALDAECLQQTLNSRGRNVGQQLVHMHNVRVNWLEHVAKNLFDKSLLLDKDVQPDVASLSNAFQRSADKINAVIDNSWEKEGKLPSFTTGLIPFVGYLISHESHHRGNILLTLKQKGRKLPDDVVYGLWEWEKN
ncbi:MAG: hypothetical protein ICV53_05055 [Flavisolibacter sp.]|nr:hypothetical protein [Flavisolibacter sp.]MBD0365455.1 hypothetical protein [Flavisolibacter sp.]